MGLLVVVGSVQVQKKVVVVLILVVDYGWMVGVVYYVQVVVKEVNKVFFGVEVVVKILLLVVVQVSVLEDFFVSCSLVVLVILLFMLEEFFGLVKLVKGKGVFIIVVDCGFNDLMIQDLYVVGDNIVVGCNMVKYLVEKMGGKGNVVVLCGIFIVIDDECIKGFQDMFKGMDMKVLDIQYVNWNSDQVFKLMQDYLVKYLKIDVVWVNDDDMLLGVLQVIKQFGCKDIKYVLGGNGMKEIVKKVIDGDVVMFVEMLYLLVMIKIVIYMMVVNFVGQVLV